jgi:hypothetical protein
MTIARLFAGLSALFLLGACGGNELAAPPKDFGDFQLGYNIVVAKNAKPVGPSRSATPAEWEAAIKAAIAERFDRYQGDKLYHIGIGVDGYALAVPGIPLVLSPKSALVVTVDVWDDAAQRTVNGESKQFTVFERLSGETVIGSGLTQSREQQMQNLSRNAARLINEWLVENKSWFTPEAVAARAAITGAQGPEKVAPATEPVPAAPSKPAVVRKPSSFSAPAAVPVVAPVVKLPPSASVPIRENAIPAN